MEQCKHDMGTVDGAIVYEKGEPKYQHQLCAGCGITVGTKNL